ncbi:hypothetical protein GCM10017717_25590 [Deinococcus persicinus]
MAILGFSKFVISPIKNSFLGGSIETVRGSSIDVAPGFIEFQASHNKYTAPDHFTNSYKNGTVMNSTVSPNIVAIM